MTKTLVAKNLLIGRPLKGVFRYGSSNGGNYHGYMFVNPCIACGEPHDGEYAAWVDEHHSMFIKCPITEERIYMIWG